MHLLGMPQRMRVDTHQCRCLQRIDANLCLGESCLAQIAQRQEVFGQGGLSLFPSPPRAVAGRGLRGQRLRE